MELTALGLGLLGVLLAEPVSRALARARWPGRDPVGALLLWQAVGLGGGISLFGAGLAYGLSPMGESLPSAAAALASSLSAGEWPEQMDPLHVGALLIAVGVLLRLLSVLVITTVRTLRARRRHRDLLDVLASPWPYASGTRVLDHPVPVAYCLPGRSSRLVVSAGVLDALDTAGVVAVLAHERAHLRERHDLVVLPFVAWGATAPFVRGMVHAQLAVARLIEMRADDVARKLCDPTELATALKAVGGSAPAAALSSFTDALEARIDRITAPPAPLPRVVHGLVRLVAVVLVAVPVWLLVAP
ncbi:M56 family metallopeptidase [Pseudonocardia sp. HH130629-09]|uniref:M56 family metallopeptidase n=1 Tax=Pseudonocardia sp. HH130629-09 TaxID=1641402 RepID=UPI0006CB06F3|nr:M56 family metallopeptidase [Pseudonocardia sp. HH130629-09]ALE83478.1 peptidase M48 Ste24p [Pseudonocardia sp. HH130629-09]